MTNPKKTLRDDDLHVEVCPECQGQVGCNGNGTWRCIAGCGWQGGEPDCACEYGLTREQVEG
jgi:hypothetical protein